MNSCRAKPDLGVRCCLAATVVLALVSAASACNVPVFRYALENWPSDAYNVVIFHRDKLTDEQNKVIEHLRQVSDGGKANVAVHVVNLAGKVEKRMQELWGRERAEELPRMIVTYPYGLRMPWSYVDLETQPLPPVALTAPVSMASAESLVSSPLRERIVKRLLDGESAVWVLVECGDAKADEAAAKTLTEELARMPSVLKELDALNDPFPEIPAEPDPALQQEQIEIRFSLLRVSRKDPAEAAFVAMLLASEPDLKDKFKDQPAVFPIFGRGRALYALVGEGITKKNITEACAFLASPCSCFVKEQNPGVDVLMTADWGQAVGLEIIELEIPPLSGVVAIQTERQITPASSTSQPAESPTVLQAAPADKPKPEAADSSAGSVMLWGLLAAAGGLLLGVIILTRLLQSRTANKD